MLGMAFKVFLMAMSQGTPGTRDIDLIGSNLKMSTQTRLEYSGLWAQIRTQGHHFGVFGALICLFEQPMELITGSKGFVSGFFGGGLAGSLVSWSQYHQSSRLTLVRRFIFQGLFIGGISYYMAHRG